MMQGLVLAIAVAILVAIAVLAPICGADSRPDAGDPPEAWFGSRP